LTEKKSSPLFRLEDCS